MKISLGRTVLLVRDYDEALHFYETNLNAKKISDTISESGKRYLHIRFEDKAFGIWLLKAETPQQLEQVGKQTASMPALVFYTDDLMEAYRQLLRHKVTISKPPVNGGEGEFSFLHFLDLYGNEMVLVQLT
ncbi:MAG: hypothetical protein DI538_05855 [Azospira oryzae]|jgi:predicted enzyme related to lactoylglutathione lyase|nr:hypothetical protein [Cytophaga sp.]PZR39863.1 MAG: hypothetical protein DI538_05855 [Azospira oryzae]